MIYKVARKQGDKYISLINDNPQRVPRGSNRIPSRMYTPNHTTRAYPNSLGIFCFNTLYAADLYAAKVDAGNDTDTGYVILEVEGVGKPTIPTSISLKFRHPDTYAQLYCVPPPFNIICYQAVRVIGIVTEYYGWN